MKRWQPEVVCCPLKALSLQATTCCFKHEYKVDSPFCCVLFFSNFFDDPLLFLSLACFLSALSRLFASTLFSQTFFPSQCRDSHFLFVHSGPQPLPFSLKLHLSPSISVCTLAGNRQKQAHTAHRNQQGNGVAWHHSLETWHFLPVLVQKRFVGATFIKGLMNETWARNFNDKICYSM